ncbi:unnamed protein product [Toxocara canis]|uniref:Nicastrin n=1 Tax=Toxocara canis TaxID=6265 RepID=A0A183UGU3_TOXCA|nr:unnamed protein product [Toxocara canis]
MIMRGNSVGLTLSIILAPCLFCYRIEDQIYLRLSGGNNQCFRLLNGTTQVGCQSEPDGNTGIVVYANSDAEMEQIISKMAKVTGMQYVIAVDVESLNGKVIEKLRDERVRGVLLLSNTNRTERQRMQFSEDSVCPNERFNFYNDACTWNKWGAVVAEGFRFIDWNKPIFLIENATEIQCFEAFNIDRSDEFSPFCAARMKFFMRGAGNAPICLRRQEYFYGFSEAVVALCDPLEDENVFAMMPPSSKTNFNADTRVFVVAARMDSFSTMTDGAVGEVSTLTSLISTLAVVDAIGKHLDEFERTAIKNNRCLMFAYFHGESMGYIGSSRAVYDMLQGNFPAKPDDQSGDLPLMVVNVSNIDAFVEVQQLDGAGSAYFAHIDGQSYVQYRHELVDSLLAAADEELRKRNRSISLVDPTENAHVPPSSYQTFLKQNRSIAGFVFAPFDDHYSYKAVNSFTDENFFIKEDKLIVEEIAASASALLATIIKYFYNTAATTPTFTIDEDFVSTLFKCFVVESDWYSCEFFSKILENVKNRPEEGTKSTYISGGNRLPSLIRLLVNAIIVHSLGKEMVNVTSESQCNDLNKAQQVPGKGAKALKAQETDFISETSVAGRVLNSMMALIYRYTWQIDPANNLSVCYRTALYTTPARSPAFEIEGYDLRTSSYSTWVESVWASQDLVLFLVPAAYPRYDVGLFITACVFFVICFLVMEAFCFGVNEPADQTSLESDPL